MGVLISVEIDRAILTALKSLQTGEQLEINYGNGSERIYVTVNKEGYAVRKDSDFAPDALSEDKQELPSGNFENTDEALQFIKTLIPEKDLQRIKVGAPEKLQHSRMVFSSQPRTVRPPALLVSSPGATDDSFAAVLAEKIKAAIKGAGIVYGKSGFTASCVTCISGLPAVKAANPERLQAALKSALSAKIPQDPKRQQAILDGVLEQLKSIPDSAPPRPDSKTKPSL